eukprot:COSAG03_NODE_16680_length_395_cov_0.361486_2_plen_58_part_01
MTPEDLNSADLDALAGGSTPGKSNSTAAETQAVLSKVYTTPDERSDKHELLLNNFSGD